MFHGPVREDVWLAGVRVVLDRLPVRFESVDTGLGPGDRAGQVGGALVDHHRFGDPAEVVRGLALPTVGVGGGLAQGADDALGRGPVGTGPLLEVVDRFELTGA